MTGEEFRKIREHLGYTQKRYAERLGLSERTIRYYESGEVPITKVVINLIQALKLDEY
jgi:Predicted transcriptional regulator